jgi:DNA-binding MarR family transcriptional regulator
MADIARITGVSRQTLYELKGRYGSAEDLRLAVLAAIATNGAVTLEELTENLGRSRSEVEAVVKAYVEGHLVEETIFLDGKATEALALTEHGEAALMDWAFPEVREELRKVNEA